MQALSSLIPLHQIAICPEQLLLIQRTELLPLLQQPLLLNQYAQQVVQAQAALLNHIDPSLTQQLSQVITEIIHQLSQSSKKLKNKRFNRLQQWLGIDIEFDSAKVHYIQQLDQSIDQANQLSRRLALEIAQSQTRYEQLLALRVDMAQHIAAAQRFLEDCPVFIRDSQTLEHFQQRMVQKIHSLNTLQSSHDLAMVQMQLNQQLAFGLIDRFKEAQQVLIPTWQYHLKLNQEKQRANSAIDITELNRNRDNLIQSLKQALENH